ncbi:MAG: hypothetical protein QXL86_00665 [Candidatus Aenigmatarchaeota archaeon]
MLFGRKKTEEIKKEELEPQDIKLPTIEEIKTEGEKVIVQPKVSNLKIEEEGIEIPNQPSTEKALDERKLRIEELRKNVPLFIKLERYEEVLDTVEELKNILKLIKDSFYVLDENERIRNETQEAIKENMRRFEERMASLDSILLKPSTQEETSETKTQRSGEMKDTLTALKTQIDKLKEELEAFK